MIGINCLLRNTSLKNDLANMVEYMGYDRMGNGKDPSVVGIWSDLRKAGVEVDLSTIGAIYKDKLSHQHEGFTPRETVDKITGRDMEQTIRNLLLMQPQEGEKQIGKMSPEEFIANGLMRAFHSNIVEDARTTSVMRELQDAAYRHAQRMMGEMPNEKAQVTPEHWTDTITKVLGLDKKGYNNLEGTINNAHTLFEGMKEELKRVTEKLNGGDEVIAAQWNEHVKALEDATYSLLLSKEQAKNVLYGTLKDAGFAKELKNGKTILDWNKLAGNINDIGKLRDTVRAVLEGQGYHPDTAIRIADSLQKEYTEMRGKMLERAKANADRVQATWDKMTPAQKREFDLNTLVNKRLTEWDNYKQLSGDNGKALQFTKGEGLQIINDALKSEGYGKQIKGGKLVLDWTKMAGELKNPSDIRAKVEQMLQKKGYSAEQAQQIAEAIQGKYQEVRQDILDHAKKKLDSMQDKVMNPVPKTERTNMMQLAELHDLGIFEGAHEDLLNHVVGISQATRQDIRELSEIGRAASELSRELDGKNYLATPIFQQFQRQVNNIISRNIANKTGLLKVMQVISYYFQLANMGIIGNAFNLTENNLSGAKEMLASNLDLLQKAGLSTIFKDGKLLKAAWRNIAAGGPEYGDEPGKFGNHSFVADRFNIADINRNTLRDPAKYGKVLGAIAIAPAKAWLNGSDGAFKAAIHRKTMMLALHKALVEQGVSKQEAAHVLNEALYGQSLDNARTQAKDMLERYNQRVTPQAIERLANNLVIQNLNADTRISDDMVQAAYESSYQVASLGLGHAANNPISKKLLAGKAKAVSEEARLIKNEQFGNLAWHRLLNTVYYNGILRFMAGGANWGYLRLQSGFGLGFYTGFMGRYKATDKTMKFTDRVGAALKNERVLDFDSPEKLQETMTGYLKAQREIQRSMVGLGFLALNAGLMYAYGASRKKKDDEDKDEGVLESAYKGVADNYVAKKLLQKGGADFILLDFLAHTGRSANHGRMEAALKYVQNNFNIGNQFSAPGLIMQAGEDVTRGEKGFKKMQGEMGQIAGNMLEVPFYRTYKQAGKLFNYAVTGADPKPQYMQPYTVWEGMLAGGALEDVGLFKRNSPIEALPGVGDKVARKAAEDGIYTMDDLKKHPGWLDENLSGKTLDKAKHVYEKLYGGDKGKDDEEGGGAEGAGAGGTFRQESFKE